MVTKEVFRNAGHPWDNRKGWDRMYVHATTRPEIDSFVAKAKHKFWDPWIVGEHDGHPAAVLYKPSGAMAPWDDIPTH
ncbi:MAG: hypothetical protein ACD_74C00157G0005 [uncultured bacterium]|jgi:hypothetical protein|nr:MAG: hypothetical protein ACD_74C00157G0005 [uncultured bacterium]